MMKYKPGWKVSTTEQGKFEESKTKATKQLCVKSKQQPLIFMNLFVFYKFSTIGIY